MKLEEIYRFFQELESSDPDEELTPEQVDNNNAIREYLLTEEQDAVDNIGRCIREWSGHVDAIKAEASRLQAKAKASESRLLKFKQEMLETLIAHKKERIRGSVYSMSIRHTPSVVIDSMDMLPKQFIKTKVETSADKIALRKALKEGDVAGCHIESNPSLQVA